MCLTRRKKKKNNNTTTDETSDLFKFSEDIEDLSDRTKV